MKEQGAPEGRNIRPQQEGRNMGHKEDGGSMKQEQQKVIRRKRETAREGGVGGTSGWGGGGVSRVLLSLILGLNQSFWGLAAIDGLSEVVLRGIFHASPEAI